MLWDSKVPVLKINISLIRLDWSYRHPIDLFPYCWSYRLLSPPSTGLSQWSTQRDTRLTAEKKKMSSEAIGGRKRLSVFVWMCVIPGHQVSSHCTREREKKSLNLLVFKKKPEPSTSTLQTIEIKEQSRSVEFIIWSYKKESYYLKCSFSFKAGVWQSGWLFVLKNGNRRSRLVDLSELHPAE